MDGSLLLLAKMQDQSEGGNVVEAKIQNRIDIDNLVQDGMGDFWDALCRSTETACAAVNAHWRSGVTFRQQGDRATVTAPEVPNRDQTGNYKPEMEIRLVRAEKKLSCEIRNGRAASSEYVISAKLDTKQIFVRSAAERDKEYSIGGLADHLVGEWFLKLNLD